MLQQSVGRRIASGSLLILPVVMMLICWPMGSARADIHYLSQGDLPADLGSSYTNDTVRITGTKISSTTDGISIQTSGVVLDLGADTVEFGTGNGDGNWGIEINNVFCTDVVIKGGTILHSGNDQSESNKCLRIRGSNGLLVDGTNMIVRGIDGRCAYTSNYQGNKMVEIKGGRYRNDGIGYYTREYFNSAIMWFERGSSLDAGEYHFKIHDIFVEHSIHAAIRIGGVVHIYNCSLIVDARNDLYEYPQSSFAHGSANSGGLSLSELDAGSTIHDNVILADSNYSGFDVGILMEHANGTEDNPILIYNNYIEGHRGLDAHYGYMNCKAMKFRVYNHHVKIYNNTFIVKADGSSSTTFRGPTAQAMEVLSVNLSQGIDSFVVIENNHFEAIDVDGGADEAAATRLEIETSASGVTWSGAGNIWRNNFMKSNRTIYNMADQYDEGCAHFLAVGDTCQSGSPLYDFATFRLGRWSTNSVDNKFRDGTYLGQTDDTDIHFISVSGAEADIAIQRTMVVTVMGNNSLPVRNAIVSVVNSYGRTVVSGSTNYYGQVSGPVTYWFEAMHGTDSTSYNPFSISVSKSGDNASTNLTVGETSANPTLTLTSTLGEEPPPGGEDTIAPSAIDDLSIETGSGSGEIDLSWTATGDDGSEGIADHYVIKYSASLITLANWNTASTAYSPPSPATSGTPQSHTLSGLTLGVEYYVAIRVYDEENNASGISNVPIACPYGLNTVTVVGSTPNVGAASAELECYTITSCISVNYTFELDTDPGFANASSHAGTVNGSRVTTTYQELDSNVTYYWRCRSRATDQSQTGSWSSTQNFILETVEPNNPPSIPVHVLPIPGSTVQSDIEVGLMVNNSSDQDGDALDYDFQIATSSNFSSIVVSDLHVPQTPGQTEAVFDASNFTDSSIYWWRARAYDGTDYSSYSTPTSFVYLEESSGNGCETSPNTPTQLSPTYGSTITGYLPTLCVQNSAPVPDCSQPHTYSFQIYTDAAMTNMVASTTVGEQISQTCFTVVSALDYDQTYYWRTRVSNGTAQSDWSGLWTFRTEPEVINGCETPPDAPVQLSPTNAIILDDYRPTLCVQNSAPVPNCSRPHTYRFQLFTDPSMANMIVDASVAQQSSQTCHTISDSLPAGETYYWRCNVTNGTAVSAWTDLWSFETQSAAPQPPILAWPQVGDIIASLQPTLIAIPGNNPGGSDTYQFELSKFADFQSAQYSAWLELSESVITWRVSENLDNGSQYYWRVRAYNGDLYSEYSSTGNFVINIETNTAPLAPAPHSPDDNSEILRSESTLTLRLNVYNGSDADYDLLTYQFELHHPTTGLIAVGEDITEGADLTGWTVPITLTDSVDYWWRARCFDGLNFSPWTESWEFMVVIPTEEKNDPPDLPVHLSPADGDILLTGGDVELVVWNGSDPDDDELTYDFLLYEDQDLTSLFASVTGVLEQVSTTSCSITGLILGETYWWRVQVSDGVNDTMTQATWFLYSSMAAENEDDYTAAPSAPPPGDSIFTNRPVLMAANITAEKTRGEERYYYFDVATDSTFISMVEIGSVLEQADEYTSWTITEPLELGETYYWRVRAGEYFYSDVSSFTVGEKVYASPNPFSLSKNDQVTFHLPSDPADLLIQTISGEMVLLASDASGEFYWTGVNESGDQVAVGVYLWYLSGTKARGKIVVKP